MTFFSNHLPPSTGTMHFAGATAIVSGSFSTKDVHYYRMQIFFFWPWGSFLGLFVGMPLELNIQFQGWLLAPGCTHSFSSVQQCLGCILCQGSVSLEESFLVVNDLHVIIVAVDLCLVQSHYQYYLCAMRNKWHLVALIETEDSSLICWERKRPITYYKDNGIGSKLAAKLFVKSSSIIQILFWSTYIHTYAISQWVRSVDRKAWSH